MAIKGLFIGINKYRDPRIRDLAGARWDAEAFGALFRDSLPTIDASTVIDVSATLANTRTLLHTVLGGATPDDTVIVSFAGHGTRDHRLVLHDSDRGSLPATTLSMDELATAFRGSKARAILFVLDCCFSGAAPARVLEDTPASRDPGTPLEDLAGHGRVLIAASSPDEPALELPGKGHGLLTKAVLDVLQRGDTEVDVLTSMSSVMDSVRADAARLGHVQTPVLLGFVHGGLVLPVLRPGSHYRSIFPERIGTRVSSRIADLAAFGIPDPVLNAWERTFPAGLNELQLQAINEHRVLDGEPLLVVAPTGAGKTFIGELAALKAVGEARKTIFLLPYKALVNEKYDDFVAQYAPLGIRVIRCTGDYQDQKLELLRGKYDIALLTYEMFLTLVLRFSHLLNPLGLVVIDETQFVSDPGRGIAVELLITALLVARERGVAPQVVALSAVISDVSQFDAWIGARLLLTTTRPVPLVEGVLDRAGQFQYLDESGYPKIEPLLASCDIRVRKDKPSSQDVIVPLVRKLVQARDETVLVFRNQRGTAEGAAGYLGHELGLPPANRALAALPLHDPSSTSQRLKECLSNGTAFHTANLSREERVVVERAFRSADREIPVIAATTTLAAGINTPASTVILAEVKFEGDDGRPFTVAEFKNMAGRAGRPGFGRPGRAIILAEHSFEREQLFRRYVLGTPEPMRSSFDPAQLDTWVLRLLAQVSRVRRVDIARLLANTYGGYSAARKNPSWKPEMERRIETLAAEMVRLGLLEQEGEFVQLTLLGRACGESSLPFQSCMRLVDLLRRVRPNALSAETLMLLMQAMPEPELGHTPFMARAGVEKARSRELSARVGYDITNYLQAYAQDMAEYQKRCKRGLVLLAWIDGVPIEAIERQYSASPYAGKIALGDVRRFADVTRYHLGSAQQIAFLLFHDQAPSEEAVSALLRRLEVGLPQDMLWVLELPVRWSRGECLALANAGIRSRELLWSASLEQLVGVLGAARAQEVEMLRSRDRATSAPT